MESILDVWIQVCWITPECPEEHMISSGSVCTKVLLLPTQRQSTAGEGQRFVLLCYSPASQLIRLQMLAQEGAAVWQCSMQASWIVLAFWFVTFWFVGNFP